MVLLMLSYLLAVCLAAIVLLAITLRKAYYFLPAKELKRQAEAGDPVASTFWRAVAYGKSLRLFLWLVIGFASACCFVLLARVAPPVLGFVAVVLLLWMAFAWLPGSVLSNGGVKVALVSTPAIVWLVGTLDPVLRKANELLDRRRIRLVSTGVYERADLLELIERQKTQPDNRLSMEELDIAAAALQFGQKHIRDITVPRSQVIAVPAQEEISLVYLDELHKSFHSSFPVYDGEPGNFVGTLLLRELTDINQGVGVRGTVRDHMSKGVVYVHESDTLSDALHAFYASKKPIFVVVNKFEEYVGIVTIEDILHALLGKPAEHSFDQHESKSAVAARHNKKPKHVDDHIDETADEPSSEEKPEPEVMILEDTKPTDEHPEA
jgi:CBS domain containing-hemolysin-like protein